MHPLARIELENGYVTQGELKNAGQERGGAEPQRDGTQTSPPCDGCSLAALCGSNLLACSRFAAFVETGRFVMSSAVPRPSRALYRSIMGVS